MRLFTRFSIVFLLASCKSTEEPPDAAPVTDSTIAAYEHQKDSIERRLQRIGDYYLLQTVQAPKCNLVKGIFVLHAATTDSSDLAFLAKHLAFELHKKNTPQPGCTYPVMSQAFIYSDSATYRQYEGDYLSMCTITNEKLTGEIFVNPTKSNAARK